MLKIVPCESLEQLSKGLLLANRVFTHAGQVAGNGMCKEDLWEGFPGFSLRNVIVALEGCQVVGLVRLVPVTFENLGLRVAAICLSSVCVDESMRGCGLSRKLMDVALDHVVGEMGADICYLIARKAVDGYYGKFGFIGMSSYQKVLFSGQALVTCLNSGIHTSHGWYPENIGNYSQFYEESYRLCLGKVSRTEAYWSYILRKISLSASTTFHEIYDFGVLVGYKIQDAGGVLELGLRGDLCARQEFLRTVLYADASPSVFSIPSTHHVMSFVNTEDVRIESRRCPYGGHMVRVFNNSRVCEWNEAVSAECAQRFKGIHGVFPIGWTAQPFFNLSFPDQH